MEGVSRRSSNTSLGSGAVSVPSAPDFADGERGAARAASARASRELWWTKQRLQDDLRLAQLKEWALDCEYETLLQTRLRAEVEKGTSELTEEDLDDLEDVPSTEDIYDRGVRSIGRKQVIVEYALLKEVKTAKVQAATDRLRYRLETLCIWAGDFLQPIFEWVDRGHGKIQRLHNYSSNREMGELAVTIEREGREREAWCEEMWKRLNAANVASRDAMASLRGCHRRGKADLREVEEMKQALLARTRQHWEERLDALQIEQAEMKKANRELIFHLRRGSNFKSSATTSAVAAQGHDPDSTTTRSAHNHHLYPHAPFTPALNRSAVSSSAESALHQRKFEALEHSEEALQAEQQTLSVVLALVRKRSGERDQLTQLRDALLHEVDVARLALADGSPAVNSHNLSAVYTCLSARRARAHEIGGGASPGARRTAASQLHSSRGSGGGGGGGADATPSSSRRTAPSPSPASAPRYASSTTSASMRRTGSVGAARRGVVQYRTSTPPTTNRRPLRDVSPE